MCPDSTSVSASPLGKALRFVVRAKGGQVTIQEALPGAPMVAAKKYADALLAWQRTGHIELYDLEDERVICRFRTDSETIPVLDDGMLRLITDAARVATAYGVRLVMPEVVTGDDASALQWLTYRFSAPSRTPLFTIAIATCWRSASSVALPNRASTRS